MLLSKGARCNPRMILNGLGHGFYDSGTAVQVAARDPQVAAKLWREMNQLESGKERNILLVGLMEKEVYERGTAGVVDAFARLENSTAAERDNVLQYISNHLRAEDPQGTIDLLRKHGSDERRRRWVVSTFEHWAKKESGEASAWLSQQPASPERDQLIVKLSDQINTADPAAAIRWARDIGDEQLRAKTVKKIEKAHGDPIVIPEE